MKINTTDKDMKDYLKKAVKEIDKSKEKKWTEYELRLLIQDEISCMQEAIKKQLEKN